VDQRTREEIARAPLGAYASGKPVDPPTEVGLTSAAMQKQMGVTATFAGLGSVTARFTEV